MKTLTHYITLVLAAAVSADELSFKDSLNEALYAENVTRDLDAAGEGYGRIVDSMRKSGFPAEDRAHAATALFRLAEVHDRQGRDEEAEKLYREFIDRFPERRERRPQRQRPDRHADEVHQGHRLAHGERVTQDEIS